MDTIQVAEYLEQKIRPDLWKKYGAGRMLYPVNKACGFLLERRNRQSNYSLIVA